MSGGYGVDIKLSAVSANSLLYRRGTQILPFPSNTVVKLKRKENLSPF